MTTFKFIKYEITCLTGAVNNTWICVCMYCIPCMCVFKHVRLYVLVNQ